MGSDNKPRGPSPEARASPSPVTKSSSSSNLNVMNLPGTSFTPLGFAELPVFIILSIVYRSEFRLKFLWPMFVIYMWKESVCMSVCLHRYFSHKGFKCGRIMQFGLYILGCMASQGPPLWWASKHRRHHNHCDTSKDPHSPVVYSKFYAWTGWVYGIGAEGPFGAGHDEEYINDHLQFPELAMGENLYWVPPLISHLGFLYFYGKGEAIFISLMSAVLCQLLTLYFNVLFHSHGDDDHDDKSVVDKARAHLFANPDGECRARDIPADPLSNIFGEAHHGWHHRFPLAHKRPGIDAPYWLFILPLKSLGLLWGKNNMAEVKVH
ncbi:hypothetical protein TL16_g00267 [Triparma laevis f. inornata]|uniref:Fatty acid desaturase domain-containing protein n=1 Tax=Triparma laevis f. inornata TaxID=1714386 RepID=A0A9W6ZDV6_9STRA|nr:hypothetical protein TL16_g00267 [Triparma laevis f. inornata]